MAGVDFTPFEGTVSLLTAATATLPDDAVLQVDLLDTSDKDAFDDASRQKKGMPML